jgi:glutamate dehydrogenase (NAD(P)+)
MISPKVKVIAEGANGPTSLDADKVIEKRGIHLIPDFLANAGGVTCSYFEQVQCNMNYYWEKDEVLGKLDTKMTSAYLAVSEMARKKNLYMRNAAYAIAIDGSSRPASCADGYDRQLSDITITPIDGTAGLSLRAVPSIRLF